MKSVLKLLIGLIGLVLLALFVWIAGPYFAFGEWRPLEPERARVWTILALVLLWAFKGFIKSLRASRLSSKLTKAIVARSDAAPQLHGDAAQLRERFEEAVGTLKAEKRAGRNLYKLPWYLIIGPPGSGKTTALVNSGLNFPLAQKFGKQSVRGVGGTRNCDWWFTDEAIFLDTAGRYTTQDSDESADSAGWAEFLNLLRKYRKRRPVNGVLVAMSASDLLTLSPEEREANVAAVRRRLDELNRHLAITLPVYVIITKCDLIAGFTEYFDDQGVDGRAQVWGTTFPYECSARGEGPTAFPAEFDQLVTRVNARLFERLEREKDVRRRAALYAFPQQLGALRENIGEFIGAVFATTRFDGRQLLRGVYLTSGTQEGTPIDRLMGALGKAFALAPQALVPGTAGRGKTYFIERLLKEVVLSESGLAGLNRRFELRKAAMQAGAYVGMTLAAVLGLLALSVSFGLNRSYLAEVSKALDRVPALPAVATQSLSDLAPWLDGLRSVVEVADKYRSSWVPIRMRWGLYQGHAVGNSARDAYLRELNGRLLPAIADGLKQRLIANTADPDKLYEYLKAYLMLGYPEHLDKTELSFLVDLDWSKNFANDPDLRASLSTHFASLFERQSKLRPLPLDDALVVQARNAIRQASIPRLMYSRLRLNYVDDTAHALRLDEAAGLGVGKVLARKSGTSLSTPVPSLYTRDVFDKVSGLGSAQLVKQFADDSWVVGEESMSLAGSARMMLQVMDIYEQDYIRAWDEILNDITSVPFTTIPQATEAMAIMAGQSSPLKRFFQVVDENTDLTTPKPGAGKVASAVSDAARATQERLQKLLRGNQQDQNSTAASKPGARVTAHFAPIHQLVAASAAGGPAPIDQVLAQIGRIQQQLNSVGSGVGETNPLDAVVHSGSGDALKSLAQQASMLPPPIAAMVAEVATRSETLTMGQARGELNNRYQQQVLRECRNIVSGRFPFTAGSGVDVPLADFGRLFGYGGIFDSFFKDNLAAVVDTSHAPWTWRGGAGGSIGGSASMLRQFEAAQQIRDTYFRPGGQLPEVHFNVAPAYLDPNATRFQLELDGQTIEYRHGPERNSQESWPGPSPGIAVISFEGSGGEHPNRSFEGPWAWFRLLDAAVVQPESDVRYRVTFRTGGNEARVIIEATSIHNPFATSVLRRFSCTG
jgi:type VI secretion system protein ImpL